MYYTPKKLGFDIKKSFIFDTYEKGKFFFGHFLQYLFFFLYFLQHLVFIDIIIYNYMILRINRNNDERQKYLTNFRLIKEQF